VLAGRAALSGVAGVRTIPLRRSDPPRQRPRSTSGTWRVPSASGPLAVRVCAPAVFRLRPVRPRQSSALWAVPAIGRSERPVAAPPWTPPQPGGLPRPPSHGRGTRGSCTAVALRPVFRYPARAVARPGRGLCEPRRRSWGSTLRGVAPARGCRGVCRPSDPPAVSPASRTDDRASPLGVTRNVCRFAGGLALLCGRWLPGDARHEQGYAKWRDCRRGLPPAAGSPAAAPGLRPRGRSVPGRAPPSD